MAPKLYFWQSPGAAYLLTPREGGCHYWVLRERSAWWPSEAEIKDLKPRPRPTTYLYMWLRGVTESPKVNKVSAR